jgi:hypothetical protein
MAFSQNAVRGDTVTVGGVTYVFDSVSWTTGWAKDTDSNFVIGSSAEPVTTGSGQLWLKLNDNSIHRSNGTEFVSIESAVETPEPEPEPEPEPTPPPEFVTIDEPTIVDGQTVVTFDLWYDKENNIRLSDVGDAVDSSHTLRPPTWGRNNLAGTWTINTDTITFTADDPFYGGQSTRWRMALIPTVNGMTTSETSTFAIIVAD